jgi:hypothetical protein
MEHEYREEYQAFLLACDVIYHPPSTTVELIKSYIIAKQTAELLRERGKE